MASISSSNSSDPLDAVPSTPSRKRSWGTTLLWLLPVFVTALVFAYGLLTRNDSTADKPKTQVGQPLADFSLANLQGDTVQLSRLQGRVVFINIWATWCKPCIDEMPTIQQLYQKLQPSGLEVLTVSLDPLGKQIVEPFMRRYQLTFPVLLDLKSEVERLYGTTGVPESFIVDKEGRLIEKIVGPRDWAHPNMIARFQQLLLTPNPQR